MANGRVELNSDIDISLSGGTEQLLTISSSGMLVLGGTRTITNVGGITLTGALTSAGTALTMTAGGDITLNGDIGLGGGALVLTAGMGDTTGNIMNDGSGTAPTLTAGSVSITQDGIFVADLLTIASNDLTLTTTATAAQMVEDWMVASGRALSLTATGNISIGAIDVGTSALTLSGMSILPVISDTMLTGGAVTLTGAVSGGNGLTIDASGDITLNDNIATGGARLTLDSETSDQSGRGRHAGGRGDYA